MGKALVVPGVSYRTLNLGTVTPTGSLPIESITISGPSSVNAVGKFTASITPIFTTQRGLVWSISSGSEYAEIDQDGNLLVTPNTDHETVTIKCESASNSSIYDTMDVTVSALELIYHEYITTDGTDFVLMPGLGSVYKCTLTIRCTMTGSNAYTFMSQLTSTSAAARVLGYIDSNGAVCSNTGTKVNFGANVSGRIYRWVFNIDVAVTQASSIYLYDDLTDTLIGSVTDRKTYYDGLFYIFSYGYGATNAEPSTSYANLCPSGAKFYGMTMIDDNNVKLAEYKPCVYAGMPGVFDTVSGIFRGGYVGNGGITAGD